jgi:hypothetical protein
MKNLFAVMILLGALAGVEAIAQEHKHEEPKEESKAPVGKGTDAGKADSMKCCEGMEKMQGMKEGMPTKTEMKANMEKMKEMKQKMAEKMKMKAAESGSPGLESKSGEPKEPEKSPHQH